MTRYGFRQGLAAFFLAERANAQALLPAGLRPVEPRPGHAIFALTALDFVESEVGAYGELVLSILVPPYAGRTDELPVSGAFPFAVATTTDASAAHTAERWRLPVLPERVDLRLQREGTRHRLRVTEGGADVLGLTVDAGPRGPRSVLYQCFAADSEGLWRVGVRFSGQLYEHQEETGELELSSHPLARQIASLLAFDIPFHEQSIEAGEELFDTLVAHPVWQ